MDSPVNRGLREGVYADYIIDWLEVFGNQLKVLFLMTLINKPEELIDDCFEFLELPAHKVDLANRGVQNASRDSIFFPLHQLAMKVNQKGEVYLNQNVKIKNLLKRLYGAINEKPVNKDIHLELRNEVEKFYKPHDARLADILDSHKLTKPQWLH